MEKNMEHEMELGSYRDFTEISLCDLALVGRRRRNGQEHGNYCIVFSGLRRK